ncbi:uncharacterized protein LOC106071108 isoform X1 [Biomphalaria glabrata]|uniref:Uncharacterized protein LOC106071108 isoform X1 n=2 Tax=Biomphalaria glabrata TaxID=6526 RepID=A0A9W2ZPZ4_BIOGL|nr:uncharacterized protein LOC106071108 isoform X1 [Biomphalaria glabrata]
MDEASREDIRLSRSPNNQVNECKFSCHYVNDFQTILRRYKEDIMEEKDKLRPLDDGGFNCKTTKSERIYPLDILAKLKKLISFFEQLGECAVQHLTYHAGPEEPTCRQARLISEESLIAFEESGGDSESDDSYSRLRSSCAHMKSFEKVLTRANEDFDKYLSYLKPQANETVNCVRNTSQVIVVEELSQMLTDAKHLTLVAMASFKNHLNIHSLCES